MKRFIIQRLLGQPMRYNPYGANPCTGGWPRAASIIIFHRKWGPKSLVF